METQTEEQPQPKIQFARWAIIANGVPRDITFSTFEIDGVAYRGQTILDRGEEAVLALGIKKIVDNVPKPLDFERVIVNPESEWIVGNTTVDITYTTESYSTSELTIELKKAINARKDYVLDQGYYSSIIDDYIQIRTQDIQNLTYLKSYIDLNPDLTEVVIRSKINVNHTVTRANADIILAGAFDRAQQVIQQFWALSDQLNTITSAQEARDFVTVINNTV